MDSFGEVFRVIDSSPDVFAFFTHDDGSAGVLAGGEDSIDRDAGIFQKHECDHDIVLGGLGVVENGGDLFEMRGAEFEGNSLDRFVGKEAQGFGVDFEDLLPFKFAYADEVGREVFVFGFVGAEGKGILVVKISHGIRMLEAASFVDFDVIHEGHDVVAIGVGSFFFAFGESYGKVIAEAAISHVGIEPGEFEIGAGATVVLDPDQDLIVCSSGDDPGTEVVVIHSQKLAGPEIHAAP